MNDLNKEIEAYISGEMSSDAIKIFESKIINNPSLKKEIELYKELEIIYDDTNWEVTNSTIKNKKIEGYESFLKSEKGKDIVENIRKVENDYFNQNSSSSLKRFLLYGVSVAAVFLVVFFGITQLNSEVNTESIYSDYKNNWEELPSLTQKGNNTNLSEAEKLFAVDKEYEKSLLLFKQEITNSADKSDPRILVYIGISQLELNRFDEAIMTFDKLRNSNSSYSSRAYWYLAMVYLKMDEVDKSKNELKELIKTPGNYNYEKAKELLLRLE